jgi:hypothetical protein
MLLQRNTLYNNKLLTDLLDPRVDREANRPTVHGAEGPA